MKKLIAGCTAAAGLALTGCGGDLCDDAESTFESLVEKASPCYPDAEAIFPPVDKESCKASLDSCTDADKDKMTNLLDCLNELDTCSTETAQTFAAGATACLTHATGISAACGVVGD